MQEPVNHALLPGLLLLRYGRHRLLRSRGDCTTHTTDYQQQSVDYNILFFRPLQVNVLRTFYVSGLCTPQVYVCAKYLNTHRRRAFLIRKLG